MKLHKLVLIASLFACCGGASADGGGSFIVQGKEFALKNAYAHTRPDPFDDSKQSTVIYFSGRAFDASQIEASNDRAAALSAALNSYLPSTEERPSQVEVVFARGDAAAPIQSIGFTIPDLSSGASVSGDRYTLDLKRNDDERIEGTLRSKIEADKNSKFGGAYFDLHFALDVHPDVEG